MGLEAALRRHGAPILTAGAKWKQTTQSYRSEAPDSLSDKSIIPELNLNEPVIFHGEISFPPITRHYLEGCFDEMV
ncbi:hypothetical protein [Nisaea sp.]|uniref:hypothetical protein n=1 Tax=Nisaea sp. TaxID=2024842 RepID=UPI0032992CE8